MRNGINTTDPKDIKNERRPLTACVSLGRKEGKGNCSWDIIYERRINEKEKYESLREHS